MAPSAGEIKSVAMLSTHGYMDPVPQLGQTDTGGQVVYVLQLAKALSKLGIRVDIYTRWFDPAREAIDPLPDHPGVRVIRVPAGPWKFVAKEEIYDLLPELSNNLIRFIRKGRLEYDLLHAHYVDAGVVGLEVARALDRPLFFTAHSLGAWKREQLAGDPEEMERKYNFEHRIAEEKRIFENVVAQTVTTDLQRAKIRQLYGFDADNIVTIPPGVDVEMFRPRAPDEPEADLGIADPYLFCLSRIDSGKGHDLLLRAFARLLDDVPDATLVIGGGSQNPEERERSVLASMQAIIDETGIGERVEIVGYVPDDLLVAYYRQARVFVLPSLFEPFGMTALEAMSCGTPVVASRLGGIQGVIDSERNGLLVDPSDRDEFATALLRILRDPALANRLGDAGRETVRKEYSWEAIAERHLSVYREYTDHSTRAYRSG